MKNKELNINGVPTLEVNDPTALNQFILIDVRRPEEFIGELGHIDKARLITLGEDLEQFLKIEDKSNPILFICRSGARSARATEQALALGFKKVFNMQGGMIYWNEKKFPTGKKS